MQILATRVEKVLLGFAFLFINNLVLAQEWSIGLHDIAFDDPVLDAIQAEADGVYA